LVPSRIRSTELERCVLGFIAQQQPCTAYAVRKALGASLSSYWSASAGSIYPLLERLADRGWIGVREDAFGSRTRRRYTLLARGRQEIERWISAPVSGASAAHTYDPLRTPVFFMDLIEADARRRYLEDAEAQTLHNLSLHRADLRAVRDTSSPWEVLGREGAIAELEARLKWIRRGLRLD
jgi:DNA-binding PadR family transcriptional regulator